ncbi:MAG: hypothetical protein NTAFB05_16700 [Nitrobacter sp.]|uniref:hypothetical protein n=1 Tax=Nitrobacter sp. TaxID=29420 RepID=UPI00387DDD17
MSSHHDAWLRHQQSRWLRPDAARWVRPDAARFLPPGVDVAKAFPALARKFNPNQTRVPAGNPDGGQWTDGGAGGGNLGLFQITPRDNTIEGVQLAGDWPPDDGPPPIPPKRPETTEGRMKFVRQAVRWLRVVGRLSPAADIFLGALDQAEELKRLTDMIKTADDPPAPLEELQARARMPPEAGYEDHHIVGQFAQNRLQFGSVRIDSAENTVRIPVVKHLDINGYYSRANIDYGGLSPRDYLRGRSWDEQMQEGLKILRDKGVLQ